MICKVLSAIAAVLSMAASSAYGADVRQVTIDTSGFAGQSGQFVIDLVDGGAPSNKVTISSFKSTGTLGDAGTIGTVVGTLPGTINLLDDSFFTEYLQDLTLGNLITFVLASSGNLPSDGSAPDGLSVFILNPGTGQSLVTTNDPTGANALFLLQMTDSDNALEIYIGEGFSVAVSPVPEPMSVSLMVAGLFALAVVGRRTPKQRAQV